MLTPSTPADWAIAAKSGLYGFQFLDDENQLLVHDYLDSPAEPTDRPIGIIVPNHPPRNIILDCSA